MSRLNALIADLLRAANDSGRGSYNQKRLLLERAITIICELREQAGIPRTTEAAKSLAFLRAVEITIDRNAANHELVMKALLLAAGMIRDLSIIIRDPSS